MAAGMSRAEPTTARLVMTAVVVPAQRSSSVVGALVQAIVHWSTLSWRPLVASVVSLVAVPVAAVVRRTEPNCSESLARVRVTARWTVSPGTRPVAGMSVLRAGAPVPMVTLPEATDSLAEVVEVKAPKVPRPATEAAPATRAREATTLVRLLRL